ADVDEPNDRGQTPLAGVAFKGNLEMAKLLVENGADVDADNGLGATAYTFALMFGRKDIAEYLLSKTEKKSIFKNVSFKILKLLKR
ncbi:MAG: ankyrin repeat domain-containing protein, partial [Campylobacter sp.]|nr:ankyrin repeat domain-containing protein [Campylobacter sp.]